MTAAPVETEALGATSGGPDFTPWPADVAERYRAVGYWRGVTLGDWFRDRAGRHATRTAVVAEDATLTYAALDARADALAARLAALGIGAGDRVVVQLPNRAVFLPAVIALFRLGAWPVFALPAHRRTEIAHLLELTGAVAYVVPDLAGGFDHREQAREVAAGAPALRHVLVAGDPQEFLPLEDPDAPVAALPAGPGAGEVAFLNLSGGSTGLPKLIPRTHDDYLYSVRASARICGLDTTTRYLCVLPVAHNFSLSSPGVLGVLDAGGTVVLSERADPEAAFALIRREGVTITALVPPLAKVWLDAAARRGAHLPTLRTLQVGGARLSDEVAARVTPVLGARLQQVFGMAEGLVNYTRDDDAPHLVHGTQGTPISPDDEIRVVDAADRDVPAGEVGRLLTRGPYTIRGYYRAAAHNAQAFTADGFYRTGDLVRRLPGGHLVVEGRAKDQVNRGGEKVAVEEVENHLLAHPAVLDAAVVAVPDPHLGERTCAVVVARDPLAPPTAGQVRGFVRDRGLAAYKVPDLVRVVDAFPTTGVGKISKARIRELLTTALEDPTGDPALPRDLTATLRLGRRAEVLAAGAPPVPVLPGPWSATPATTSDADLVAGWMAEPDVERFWDQAWPAGRWSAYLAAQAAGDWSRPLVVRRDGVPVAYVEVYRAARDLVGGIYDADPADLGVHLALGAGARGHGWGSELLAALADALTAADPGCTRVVADPDVRNDHALAAFTRAGFRHHTTGDLGHKQAALLVRPAVRPRGTGPHPEEKR